MLLVGILIALGVLFGIAAVVAGRGGSMKAAEPDSLDTRVPPEGVPMAPTDVDGLRFGLAFRGYRMDQVDDALDRLREELRLRDEQLGGAAPAPRPAPPAPPEPAPTPEPPQPAAAGPQVPATPDEGVGEAEADPINRLRRRTAPRH